LGGEELGDEELGGGIVRGGENGMVGTVGEEVGEEGWGFIRMDG